MALLESLIGVGGSILGGLLAGNRGQQQPQLSPTGWVQASTAPALGDYIAKTLAAASADRAPTDFQVSIGDMTLPFNLAARRRQALANPALQAAGSLFRGSMYEPMTKQSSLYDSLLPIAAQALGRGGGYKDVGKIFNKLFGSNDPINELQDEVLPSLW